MTDFITLCQRAVLPTSSVSDKYQYDKPIPAYIVNVYDGDTMTIKFFQTKDIICENSIRIHNINTPEISRQSDLEELAGRYVRDYVRQLVEKACNRCFIKIYNIDDKYGRIIADVFLEPANCNVLDIPAIGSCINISQHLLSLGYATEYDGGTKKTWSVRDLLHILGADDGFHTIDWDYKHKDFLVCLESVLDYYSKIEDTEKLTKTLEKLKNLVYVFTYNGVEKTGDQLYYDFNYLYL